MAASASLALALAAPANAQQVVYDPTSFAQMVKDARTAMEQLDALKAQVRQGQELFNSLNDLSNVNAVAGSLGLPEIRNPLPDLATLRAAADGDLSALGDLAERADATTLYCVRVGPNCQYSATTAVLRRGAAKRVQTIDAAYLAAHDRVAEDRVRYAGFRLAHLMNQALDPAYTGPVANGAQPT